MNSQSVGVPGSNIRHQMRTALADDINQLKRVTDKMSSVQPYMS